MTDKKKELVQKLIVNVEALGYQTKYGSASPDRPNEQLLIGRDGRLVAKVSLMLAARINTMFNGVGRREIELLKVLTQFSVQL